MTYPTVSNFRNQIKFIINKYIPISIVDFIKISEDKSLICSYSKPPVLLGFDDGYKNIINLALPVLNEFKIPALFFINGEILKNSDFVPWHIEFKYLLHKTKKKVIDYNKVKIDLASKHGYQLLVNLFETSYKACRTEKDRQGLFKNLADILDLGRPSAYELNEDLRLATKEDLFNLDSTSLLKVVSHAMTHNHLANLTREEQIYELEQSDFLLRENCPSYYPTISYPSGSFNADTIAIAKRLYRCAFAVMQGASYRNLYAYPRIGLGHHTLKELSYIMSYRRLTYYRPIKQFLHKIGIGTS
jgi:peptidoglycan/xylan/chitin deacetylase (PgdA/CDA1 family)